MTYVATLMSMAPHAPLTEPLLRQLALHLPHASHSPNNIQWLDEPFAADIGFESDAATLPALDAALRSTIGDRPIDLILQPQAGRRKRLLVADMDSTMIAQECLDELADVAGLRAHVAAITERAMRGEIAFEPALIERVGLLAGLSTDVIAQIIVERITLMPGARTLVQTMRAHGAHTALISGGFTLFVAEVAARIGFDAHYANELIIEDGRLAGRIKEPILGMAAKLAVLDDLCDRLNIAHDATLAVGDGANDLAMLAEAGLGVAYHAKPAVAAATAARIDHCDLTALLYAQGYRRAEFCEISS